MLLSSGVVGSLGGNHINPPEKAGLQTLNVAVRCQAILQETNVFEVADTLFSWFLSFPYMLRLEFKGLFSLKKKYLLQGEMENPAV